MTKENETSKNTKRETGIITNTSKGKSETARKQREEPKENKMKEHKKRSKHNVKKGRKEQNNKQEQKRKIPKQETA